MFVFYVVSVHAMAVSVGEKACLLAELTWELSVMRISLYFVWGFMRIYAVLYSIHDFVYLNIGTLDLMNLGNTEKLGT